MPLPGSSFNVPNTQQPTTLSVTFTEPIDPASVNTETVLLTDQVNNPVPFNISFGEGNFTVMLTTQARLSLGQVYTVALKGGVGEPHITNPAGTPLVADYTWSFFADAPLIIASTEVTMHSDWDAAGGSFVAMRPDKLLAPLLGINGESSLPVTLRSVGYWVDRRRPLPAISPDPLIITGREFRHGKGKNTTTFRQSARAIFSSSAPPIT